MERGWASAWPVDCKRSSGRSLCSTACYPCPGGLTEAPVKQLPSPGALLQLGPAWLAGWLYYASLSLTIRCAPQILFEGIPTYPDAGRWWELVDKYKVSSSCFLLACLGRV